MTTTSVRPSHDLTSTAPSQPDAPDHLHRLVLPALIVVLALAAGALHLAHNYLPVEAPPGGAAGPLPGGPAPGGSGPSGLMGLIMPHLTEVFILNFVGYVVLAVAFLVVRAHRVPRMLIDAALVVMSAVTLYAWNALGRANPAGTGTLALVVEAALIVVALVDAWLTWRVARQAAARFSWPVRS